MCCVYYTPRSSGRPVPKEHHTLGRRTANWNDRVHFYCGYLSNLCSTASNFYLVLTLLRRSVKASSSKIVKQHCPRCQTSLKHHPAATEQHCLTRYE